jgi:ABC-type nickel/cobalt efflux system permease component RcnA
VLGGLIPVYSFNLIAQMIHPLTDIQCICPIQWGGIKERLIFAVLFGLGGGAAGIFILFFAAILDVTAIGMVAFLSIPIGVIIGAIYGFIWSGKD